MFGKVLITYSLLFTSEYRSEARASLCFGIFIDRIVLLNQPQRMFGLGSGSDSFLPVFLSGESLLEAICDSLSSHSLTLYYAACIHPRVSATETRSQGSQNE